MRVWSVRTQQVRCAEVHCPVALYCAFVAMALGISTPSVADEPGRAMDDAEKAFVVKLQEGAKSPRAALSAFVAATNAGDVEATLRLIDPQFRPLLRTEVLLEGYILEGHLLRNLLMNDEERKAPTNNLGAFPLVFARRDLVRTSQLKILKERPSSMGENHVLLDVAWQVRSWNPVDKDHRFDHATATILAVRRQQRWYLFHPFGSIFAVLRNTVIDKEGGSEAKTVLEVKRLEQDDPKTSGTDYVFKYHVPIEVVHEEFVRVAQSPGVSTLLGNAEDLVRFQNVMKIQFLRGDFSALKELDTVLDENQPALEAALIRYFECVKPAAIRLSTERRE